MILESVSQPNVVSKTSAAEILFSASFAIWLVSALLWQSMYAQYIPIFIHYAVRIICIAILLLAELVHSKDVRQSVFGLVVLSLLSYLLLRVSYNSLVDVVFFIFCSRWMRFDDVLKLALVVITATSICIVVSSQIGLIKDYVVYNDIDGIKHYLGFRYSLYPGVLAFMIIAMVFYIRRTVRFVDLLWAILLLMAVFLLCKGTLSLILGICFVAVYFVVSRSSNDSIDSFLWNALPYLFCAVFLASIVLTVMYGYGSSIAGSVNSLMEGRLALGNAAIQEYGLSLFGKPLALIGNGLTVAGEPHSALLQYNYVDNLYVKMLLQCGAIPVSAFLVLTVVSLKRIKAHGDKRLLVILAFIALWCFIDDLPINLYFDPFLVAFSAAFKTKAEMARSAVRHL